MIQFSGKNVYGTYKITPNNNAPNITIHYSGVYCFVNKIFTNFLKN